MSRTPYTQELFIVLILATVQFAHILDFVVIMPLGPTLMESFSIGPARFAGLVSSYHFSAGVCSLFFGLIADSFDRKKLLLFFMTFFSLGTLSCYLATSFEMLLLARVMTGAFGGILNSIVYAIIADVVPSERRGRAMGIVMSAFSVSSVLGIPLGLMISDKFDWHYSFLFIFIICLLCLILSAVMIPPINEHLKSGKSREGFFKAIKVVLSNSNYQKSFFFMFLVSGSTFLLIPFLSPYAVNNMLIPTVDIKYMYLFGGLLTIVTARVFGVLTDIVGGLKLYSIILFTAFIPILLFTSSGPISFIKYIALGASFMSLVSGRMIPCMTMLSEVPSLEDRGIFMGMLNSIRTLGSALMTFIGGFIITQGANDKIVGFDRAGYISMIIGIMSIFLAQKIRPYIVKSVE